MSNALFGYDLFGEPITPKINGQLAKIFLAPPFSVLDTRSGQWQERKRAWKALGIKSEVGRQNGQSVQGLFDTFNKYDAQRGRVTRRTPANTSIFDPVLCELSYRWFCPPYGQVLDPFAGGSVRGIVAACLDYHYWGCDLRQKQIDANKQQGYTLCDHAFTTQRLRWVCGDSLKMLSSAPSADFLFTCPPYGDLEVYSDDPRDLSSMNYTGFLMTYTEIIGLACQKLKENRFATIVVSNFRDKNGNYRNFTGDTINTFEQHGLSFYNDAILLNVVGSLPIRITKQFKARRKLGKCHQNVLTFVKGSAKKATQAIEGNL